MELSKEYETQCRQVWIEAWTKTAQSNSCHRLSTPTTYADACLEEFKKRFFEEVV